MQKISGNEVSKKILKSLREIKLSKRGFTAVLVGSDPISLNFLKKKRELAESLGLKFKLVNLAEDVSESDLKKAVLAEVSDHACGGIIVQLPLPHGISRHEVLDLVPMEKDVDVLGREAVEAFHKGKSLVLPPPVGVVAEIVSTFNLNLKKSKVAVLGMGLLIGRPIADWLAGIAHELITLRKGSDLAEMKDADLVVSGVGLSGIIKPGMLKVGASVIDFGYDYRAGELSGDLDAGDKRMLEKLSFYTPTPGGTGPILIAKLFENFFKLNQK